MAAESAVRVIFLGDSASAVRSVSRLESSFGSLGKTAKLVTGAIGIAMVGALAGATKAAIDFDRSMRNVNSIAKLSETQFKSLEKQVLSLGKQTGQTPKVLADGLYDIVSSGFKANDAIKILAVSAKAATAGMTDTATASKAVVAILNAYHLSADKAKNVSSLLFTEVNKGVNTFEELAQNIGDTAPLAAQLKIPFSDVSAALALITLHGTSMAEASTQVSRVMTDLLKPSDSLKKTFHDLGYENGQAAIQAHGFIPLLKQLSDQAHGNAATTADWFQNIRSLRGILNLTGPNLKLFNRFAAEMAQSFQKGGADVAAFNEQSKSISVQWAKAKSALIAAAIPVGQLLFPALKNAAGAVEFLATQATTKLPIVTGAIHRFVTDFTNGFSGFQQASQHASGSVHHNAASMGDDVTKLGSTWDRIFSEMGRDSQRLRATIVANWGPIASQARNLAASVRSSFQSVRSAVHALQPVISALAPEFKVAFAVAIAQVRLFLFWVRTAFTLAAAAIRLVAPPIAFVITQFNNLAGKGVSAAKSFASGVTSAFNAVVGAIKTVIHWIEALIGAIKSIPHDISVHLHLPGASALGKLKSGIGGLIHRAEGGFIPGSSGSPVPIIAHAGEVVLNQAQQAAFGGASTFKRMFGFTGGEGPAFAAGGIVSKPKRRHSGRSPHSKPRGRVHSSNKAARAAIAGVDAINQREDDADRSYGQLVRLYDISQEVFIRQDANGNDYISKPDINQRVAEIDSLIKARQQMLDLLAIEKKRLQVAIARLRKAIAAMIQAIRAENKAVTELNKQIARENRKKKPNQNLISRWQQQVGAHQDRARTLSSTIGDFRSAIKDEQLNLGHNLPYDRRDVELDILTLQQERKDVVGTTLTTSGGQSGGGGSTGGTNVDDLLRQIGQLRLALGIQTAQTAIIGSFAKGTLTVPETGLALVHAGETIRPAAYAPRGGDGPSIGDIQVKVVVEDGAVDANKIRVEAVKATDAIMLKMGTSASERLRSGRL